MTAVFAARRRAEEFARLLDDPSPARVPADRRELLAVVTALRETPPVEPRPEFVSELRARLMSAADTLLVPAPATAATAPETARLTLPPRRRRRERRLAAAVGGLALVGATTSMALASQTALPGDSLYPVKRAIEDVHVRISSGGADTGEVLLQDAAGRLAEVSALSRGDEVPDASVVADTLDTFSRQATEASDLLLADYARHGRESSIRDLRDFDATSLARLTVLETLVPAAARDELMDAAHVLFQIDAAAQRACPTCGGVGIHEVPGVFAPAASGSAPTAVPSSTLHPRARPHGGAHGARPAAPGPALPGPALPGETLGGDATATGGGRPGGAGAQPAEDPLGDLAGTLTGGTALPTAAPTPGPRPPLVADTDKAVKDATETVKDGLQGTLEDATSGDLTDPLLP